MHRLAYLAFHWVLIGGSLLGVAIVDFSVATSGVQLVFVQAMVLEALAGVISLCVRNVCYSETEGLSLQSVSLDNLLDCPRSNELQRFRRLIGVLGLVVLCRAVVLHIMVTLPLFMHREVGKHFGYMLAVFQCCTVLITPLMKTRCCSNCTGCGRACVLGSSPCVHWRQ